MNNVEAIVTAIQGPIVLSLIVFSYHIWKKTSISEFRFISYAWLVNFFYISTNFIFKSIEFNILPENLNVYFKVDEFTTSQYSEFIVVSFLDILNTFIFYLASKASFINKYDLFSKLNVSSVLSIFLFTFIIKILFPFLDPKFSFPFILVNIPSALINFSVILMLSRFFIHLSTQYSISLFISYSFLSYAYLQLLDLVQKNIFSSYDLLSLDINGIGFTLGLFFKTSILLSFVLLILELNKKYSLRKQLDDEKKLASQLSHVIARTFHEISPQLLNIDTASLRLNRLLQKEKREYKSERYGVTDDILDLLDSIESSSERTKVIMIALNEVYQSEYLGGHIEGGSKFENNYRSTEKININTQIEIAILQFKGNRYIGSLTDKSQQISNEIQFRTYYGGNCKISGVGEELVQVVYNLIINSFEAFFHISDIRENVKVIKNQKCIIFIKTQNIIYNSEKYIQITYEDNGPGINELNVNKIFDFGFSTKNKFKNNRGIGLGIVKQIVTENFKGEVEVGTGGMHIEEKFLYKGQGVQFKILLPKL